MRAFLLVVSLQLVVGAGALNGQSGPEEAFLGLEQAWTEALARGDSTSLARLLGADFTLIAAGVTTERPIIDREQYLRNALRDRWPRREVRVIDVNLLGDVAVVRCVWRGPDPPPFPTPNPEAEVFEFLLTDIWARRDDGWQVVARHSSFASSTQR